MTEESAQAVTLQVGVSLQGQSAGVRLVLRFPRAA